MAKRSYYRTEERPEGDLRYPMAQNVGRGLRGRSYHTPADVARITEKIAGLKAVEKAACAFQSNRANWSDENAMHGTSKIQDKALRELESWKHELEHARTVVGHKAILKRDKLARALAAKPVKIR